MPIGPDSPNPRVIDFFVIMWFVSMFAGIVTNQTFTWFEYLFSFLGGLYIAIRVYYTWFYKAEIDPKFKNIWDQGYEEGVKKLKEHMDEEETQDCAELRRDE